MHSWFNAYSWKKDWASYDEFFANYAQDEIVESVDVISKLIEEEAKILGSTQKVFVGGHS